MPQPTVGHKELIIAHVALGSNATSSFGTPFVTLSKAIDAISNDSVKLLAQSRFFRSPAFPKGSGPDYVNGVITVQTSLSASALLTHLHAIEAEFERQRTTRWASRTLDLDLLDFAGKILPDEATLKQWMDLPLERQKTVAPDQLLLPHPRLQDRAFVLIPLAEVAPDWVHPMTGKGLPILLSALSEAEKRDVCPLE
ncbi:2-amino-4-hydroxy-6-hydroxymethyldihydropteridine diphosphokinase [uncultured Litoreibacter sp.]|uniref:2-amino-4-hydroxy-6- hydroxymethyldihydropteridine diphosphokinase n=1 Tax=uncultured Litoreibacter sp. TaxID=1392394 RepID=UPI00262FF2A3|nr:2-amino-4-hydroxy-6-hydroxymethyldihydropteridine diphosphokinase [uncultured Litoreibacter sp.]